MIPQIVCVSQSWIILDQYQPVSLVRWQLGSCSAALIHCTAKLLIADIYNSDNRNDDQWWEFILSSFETADLYSYPHLSSLFFLWITNQFCCVFVIFRLVKYVNMYPYILSTMNSVSSILPLFIEQYCTKNNKKGVFGAESINHWGYTISGQSHIGHAPFHKSFSPSLRIHHARYRSPWMPMHVS